MRKLIILLTCMLLLLPIRVEAATVKEAPSNSSFKTWMGYTAITSVTSPQYKLQQKCTTGDYGIRTYDGRYCIALGTYYTKEIGQYVDVELTNGTILKCVLGDVKSDKHTDSMNRQMSQNGNVVEFIVDMSSLDSRAKSSGNISSIPGFEGDIKSITLSPDTETPVVTAVINEPKAVAIYSTSNVETYTTR